MIDHNRTKCFLCNDEAIAVYYFSHGCTCSPETVQPLYLHHAYKSRGIGSKELIKDLSVGEEFSKNYDRK